MPNISPAASTRLPHACWSTAFGCIISAAVWWIHPATWPIGRLPGHPELLDWLAADFMKNGWRLKRLHKLIMTGRPINKSPDGTPKGLDPDNRLLGRMNVRRMEAETIRDMLALSGQISLRLSGKRTSNGG